MNDHGILSTASQILSHGSYVSHITLNVIVKAFNKQLCKTLMSKSLYVCVWVSECVMHLATNKVTLVWHYCYITSTPLMDVVTMKRTKSVKNMKLTTTKMVMGDIIWLLWYMNKLSKKLICHSRNMCKNKCKIVQ